MKRPKPKVGDTLYRLYTIHNDSPLERVVVTKVGRKYFTVERDSHYKIESEHFVENWKHNAQTASWYKLYASEEEYKNEVEEEALRRYINITASGRLPYDLATLRKIVEVLRQATSNEDKL